MGVFDSNIDNSVITNYCNRLRPYITASDIEYIAITGRELVIKDHLSCVSAFRSPFPQPLVTEIDTLIKDNIYQDWNILEDPIEGGENFYRNIESRIVNLHTAHLKNLVFNGLQFISICATKLKIRFENTQFNFDEGLLHKEICIHPHLPINIDLEGLKSNFTELKIVPQGTTDLSLSQIESILENLHISEPGKVVSFITPRNHDIHMVRSVKGWKHLTQSQYQRYRENGVKGITRIINNKIFNFF